MMFVYTDHKVTSLKAYIDITKKVYQSWAKGPNLPDPWFRGVPNATHDLKPSYFRIPKDSGVDEGDLRDEFERRAPPLLDGRTPRDKWDWYFLMQHYGLPTRLLDWSESSLVGLFFAVTDYRRNGKVGQQDSAVWMLDPWYLNNWSVKKDEVLRTEERLVFPYLPDDYWDERKIPKRPVAIMPAYNSTRITAQRGMFTLHGTNRRPLENLLPKNTRPHFVKITIPKAYIPRVSDELRIAGISEVVAFPELPYLCSDILNAWGV